jgi:alanyl-tRNA synthetase
MVKKPSGNEIRQQFIDFFVNTKGHTFVPSSSLVPGGDATLLFTNAGMVQFKDVFLGTDKRPYKRAVNSQKCMRVAGKHNDLEDVGFDDTHHTFFEMLGNWSFGDYYKKEAIAWGWELLTEVWGMPKDRLYATVFKDELDEIPVDEKAAEYWRQQPGIDPTHIQYCGRKDNFWEMADTGPCGPNSEIHYDRGTEYGEITHLTNGDVDLDGPRFVELWNLVFMQYNRISPTKLEPLPATHVDTGLGLERIVAVLQDEDSNYRTDLFWPVIQRIQELAGQNETEREENFTPYRVIADHGRAATFLIADGVVPGNLGRNYITRMVIRRAARFGSKIGLNQPFLAEIAEVVIDLYGEAYPELVKNRQTILDNLTREEERFQRTVESGIEQLHFLTTVFKKTGQDTLDGENAFNLYATFGLPLEITRDILSEQGYKVDESGFHEAMEAHRIASGGGKAMGDLGGEDAELFSSILKDLQEGKKLDLDGIKYDPYHTEPIDEEVLALVVDGERVDNAGEGDQVAVILPSTNFYLASGGQVSDTGLITAQDGKWQIQIDGVGHPAAGVIAHYGRVLKGKPRVGDKSIAQVDLVRRQDIQRNHTATHLLHAVLHKVLGDHARQAGSLVAPDRLRFDFTHPQALTTEELEKIEDGVNQRILENHPLNIEYKSLDTAKAEGAIALFGEKYGDTVRTVQIGGSQPFSYELCGGTHIDSTGEIGTFIITSEGSAAAGIRRIEAVTGSQAYRLVQQRMKTLQQTADLLKTSPEQVEEKVQSVLEELHHTEKERNRLIHEMAADSFDQQLQSSVDISGVKVLTLNLPGADRDTLREMADKFRQKVSSGVAVLAALIDDRPALVAAVTKDLIEKGIKAGDLVNVVAEPLGGKGGGRPDMAQAGGKDAARIDESLNKVIPWVKEKLGN